MIYRIPNADELEVRLLDRNLSIHKIVIVEKVLQEYRDKSLNIDEMAEIFIKAFNKTYLRFRNQEFESRGEPFTSGDSAEVVFAVLGDNSKDVWDTINSKLVPGSELAFVLMDSSKTTCEEFATKKKETDALVAAILGN